MPTKMKPAKTSHELRLKIIRLNRAVERAKTNVKELYPVGSDVFVNMISHGVYIPAIVSGYVEPIQGGLCVRFRSDVISALPDPVRHSLEVWKCQGVPNDVYMMSWACIEKEAKS